MQLCGWMNRMTGEERIPRPKQHLVPLAFSGIQGLSPAIFPMITETGPFSLTDLYISLCRDYVVHGYEDISPYWRDAGNGDQNKNDTL
jgi:N-acetyl-alpha-D-muramate 1-phosphate uridylyltransferase